MYINWDIKGNYDLIMVDWYCEEAAPSTYWAVHQWSGGYAGFQYTTDGKYKIILSLWNSGSYIPEIEYMSSICDTSSLDFGGEGEGKHVSTNYAWNVNTWYTMCIGVKTMCGKTFYAQWVKKQNDDNWFLAVIMSMPIPNLTLNKSSVFQEDYNHSEQQMRKCRIRKAYGRFSGENRWDSWNRGEITNTYFEYEETTWSDADHNITFNCDWGTDSNNNYIWIQSGGNTPDNGKPNPPTYGDLNQPSQPTDYPEWIINLLPRCIKRTGADRMINPYGNQVLQRTTPYFWNFVSSDDGYFFILNTDNSKAIAISSTANGADLILEAYNSNADTQKWTKLSGDKRNSYLFPKMDLTKNVEVENKSLSDKTPVQLWSYNDTKFLWEIYEKVEMKSFKNNHSGKYMAPLDSALVQRTKEYKWNIVQSASGYFYILTLDNTKAVTISGHNDGCDLILTDFNPALDTQKWTTKFAATGLYYISSKAELLKSVEVENARTDDNAPLQIWSHFDSDRFQWIIQEY